MGLDQYLMRGRPTATEEEASENDRLATADETVAYDSELGNRAYGDWKARQVGYWRKANAIHAWFVDHIGAGVDECQIMEVNAEHLAGLLATCRRVLADPALAHELLPSRSGFFFGGTDYDDGYLADLRDTVKILEPLLDAYPGDPQPFFYQASW